MNGLPDGRRGRVLAAGLFLCLLGLIWFGVVDPLLDLYRQRVSTLNEHIVLAEKMAAISQEVPSLRIEALARSRTAVDQIKLKGSTDGIAEANLSMLVEHLAADAGVHVTSVEAAPIEKARTIHKIGITIRADGDYRGFIGLLKSMSKTLPQLFIDGLQLHTAGEGGHSPAIEVILTIYAVRSNHRAI